VRCARSIVQVSAFAAAESGCFALELGLERPRPKSLIMKNILASSLFLLALPLVAWADRPQHHPPPPAAFDACAKSRTGDACSVTFGDHTLTGTCTAAADSQQLACHPDRPPGPPPEAREACRSRSAGEACSVTFGDHTVTGTCATGPDGTRELACRPDHPPPR
jgi:hypothetical protein